MPRNKYPEETREKIIEVASQLFMENGYEHTTIQDIINNLGGLTKGAVYHHFKSKEEIMLAVTEKVSEGKDEALFRFLDDRSLNGMEKLREMIRASLNSSTQVEIFSLAPDLKKCPQIFVSMVEETMGETAGIVQRIIEEGVADGSLHTEYPKEAAQIFLLLTNIWMNPLIIKNSIEDLARKYNVLNTMLEGLGIKDLMDEEMLIKIQNFQKIVDKRNE